MTRPQIVYRPWHALRPPSKDARKSRDPAAMERLKADIAKRGIRSPLYIKPCGEVISGESRCQVAVDLRIEEVPCIILERPLSPSESLVEQLQENDSRSNFSPLERAELFQQLLDLNGFTPTELAEHLGHPNASLISKTLTVKRGLAAELQQHVTSGKLPFTAAYHLARLDDVPTQVDLCKKLLSGLLKRDSVAELISTMLGGKKPRRPKPVRLKDGGPVRYSPATGAGRRSSSG